MEGSMAVAVIPEEERNLRGLELAERHFPPERRAQVASFLEIPPEHPALLPYLAWCASLNLSPIAGHVWLIPKKIKAKDGEPARTIYKPAIGRDGLLHKARTTKHAKGGYRGMKFGTVCARDTFEWEDDEDPMRPPRILHRYASKPTEFPHGEDPTRYRGPVIGAWAIAFVEGEPPTAYYANIREHGRTAQVWDYDPAKGKRQPLYRLPDGSTTFDARAPHAKAVQEWEGAWDYTSSMVLKSAQSYVLRIALGVTGVVPVDELRDPEAWKRGEDAGTGESHGVERQAEVEPFDIATVMPAGSPAELGARLREGIELANKLEPYSWGPAKCEMVLANRSIEELEATAEQIERENELRIAREIKRAESRAGVEEEVIEGEVVEEPREKPIEERQPEVSQERIDVLRAKRAELQAARFAAPEEQQADVIAELDQVEAELKALLGPDADLG